MSTHDSTAADALRKPSYTRKQFTEVRGLLGQGIEITRIAETTGLSRQTVYRMKNDPAEAKAALIGWEAKGREERELQ